MKWYWNIIIIVVAIGGFLGVWFWQGCGNKIKIIKETKTIYKTIKVPQTPEEILQCCNDPIQIKGSTRADWLDIEAGNGWHSAQKSFQIGCFAKPKDIFSASPGVLAGYNHSLKKWDWGYKGALNYLRMWSNLGIGCGADAHYMNVSKDWYVGAHATFAVGK